MRQKNSAPEHNLVRKPFVEQLTKLGWDLAQIQTAPEWQVPKNPHSASRREAGNSYDGFPVDIAVFSKPDHFGDYRHLSIIVETKAPDIEEGRNQLEIYMSLEPHVRLGIWTNGTNKLLLYRAADGSFVEDKGGRIPKPTDSLLSPAKKPLKYADLKNPKVSLLRSTFQRLLDIIVARDTKSSRGDEQLNQICNLILVKLESDKLASNDPTMDLVFQYWDDDHKTAQRIQEFFITLKSTHADLFANEPYNRIHLDDHTIASAVYELTSFKLYDVSVNVISEAFQVFRTESLKAEEGQYYTPQPVVRSAVKFMDVKQVDVVIDPACGTGGFLFESYRQLREKYPSMKDGDAKAWAQRHLYGIDKDRINVKLTKALMLIIGDGSTHTYVADSLRVSKWHETYPEVMGVCKDGQYSCVITNPPFGKKLTFSALDGAREKYEVCRKPRKSSDPQTTFVPNKYEEREIGIVFLERCHRLLRDGGKLGIILPETYMFSPSYAWLQGWLAKHFTFLGMLNIPMEAFQGFCRAKTNFYVFRKVGSNGATTPNWVKPDKVLSINAPTCGINKDGQEQYVVDATTGLRTDVVDDQLGATIDEIMGGKTPNNHSRYISISELMKKRTFVPAYFDDSYDKSFSSFLKKQEQFTEVTLSELKQQGLIELRGGHGSPSQDQRVGDIPYIKVSDLRAGLININPTNLVPLDLAKTYWKRKGQTVDEATSGLFPYDLISPERASKNIGEFCVLLPGQENILLTKEVIIVRAKKEASFDQFYLMWALSLSIVRRQWQRIVFMQTNREDVGKRYLEIKIPLPKSKAVADKMAQPFKDYFQNMQKHRANFISNLGKSGFDHHIFFS